MMNSELRPLMLLMYLCVVCMIGCGPSESSGQSDHRPSMGVTGTGVTAAVGNAEPTGNSTVHDAAIVDELEGFAPLDPRKDKWDRDTAASAEIPTGIPVYPKSVALDGSSSDRLFVFHWETNDLKSDVMDFYRKELPASNWEIVTEKSFGSFKATKAGQELDVWIGHEEGKPVSILIRLTR